jgi:hypothetical protein
MLLARIRWRRLLPAGQLWALSAMVNAILFFGMPTTAATSAWRPVVGGVLAGTAGVSFGLLMLGLVLRERLAGPSAAVAWRAALILAALPGVFYAFM